MSSRPPILQSSKDVGRYIKTLKVDNSALVGLVLDVDLDNKTATVQTSSTESVGQLTGIPWLSPSSLPGGGGYNYVPMRGSLVLMINPGNFHPVIVGSYHQKIDKDVFNRVMREILYEDSFPEHKDQVADSYSGSKSSMYDSSARRLPVNQGGLVAKDLHYGDQEISGPDQEKIGVYRGGIVRLMTSHVSQLISYAFRHLIRIVARRFELWTDHGKLEFLSDNNETKMLYRAGASFNEESHPNKELWRLWMHTGSGEYLTSTHVTEPTAETDGNPPQDIANSALYTSWVKPSGEKAEISKEHIHTMSHKNINEKSNKDITETATENIKEKAGKDISNKATENIKHLAGKDISHEAGNNVDVTAGSDMKLSTLGGDLTAESLANIIIKAVNELTQTAMTTTLDSSVQCNIKSGAMTNITSGAVNISASTIALAGAVLLGGPLMVSPTGLVMAGTPPTPLPPAAAAAAGLKQLLTTAFIDAFNTHTHTHGDQAGTTTPPVVPIVSPTPDMIAPMQFKA